jgi:diguanylate cyclase (GGDEF)-like protein
VVVDRLRRKFEAERFLFHGQAVHITASFGFDGKQARAPELAHLIEEADRALYSAKHAGRNCFKIGIATR